MRPYDTHAEAHEVQLRLYRAMTPCQRSELALRMSDDIRRVSLDGIRARHPEYSEAEARRALVGLLYGRQTASRIWPNAMVPSP